MLDVKRILEKKYSQYGKTIASDLPKAKQDLKRDEILQKWNQAKKNLVQQDISEIFELAIDQWITGAKYPHIKTVSDLKYFGELVSMDNTTRISLPEKVDGLFTITVYIHENDEKKSFVHLFSDDLNLVFRYTPNMKEVNVAAVMGALSGTRDGQTFGREAAYKN